MSFWKFSTNSYCVVQKYYSATKNIVGYITFHEITGKEVRLLVGEYSKFNRKKFLIVSDNTIVAERLGDFFKNLCEKGPNASKLIANNSWENLEGHWILLRKMLVQLHPETLKGIFWLCLMWKIFIILAKDYISESLFKFLYN